MRMMDGAIKRVMRMSRTKSEYFLAMVDDVVFTTTDIFSSMDFTEVDDVQLAFITDNLLRKGYKQAHLVTFGMRLVDEYGVERFYEKEFNRTILPRLMDLVEDDYNELTGEDGES